jgi:hypothetical protein
MASTFVPQRDTLSSAGKELTDAVQTGDPPKIDSGTYDEVKRNDVWLDNETIVAAHEPIPLPRSLTF